MANFGPKDIKKLREMTSAGMMDCKKALTSADGDMDKAIEWLKEKGLGAAAKKAGKVAAEGLISIKVDGDKAVLVEINSQTDFVAQNETFINVTKEIAEHAFDNSLEDADAINNSEINSQSFADYLSLQISKIGENLVVRKSALLEGNDTISVNGYVHANGRIGVIIAAKCSSKDVADAIKSDLKNISMHISAMNPKTLSYRDFDEKFVEDEIKGRIASIEKENIELHRLGKKEKTIPQYISMSQLTEEVLTKAEDTLKEELKAEGKPEKIWDRILPGKLARFIADNTTLDKEMALLDQDFVMDDKITVAQHLENVAKKAGGSAEIASFTRLEVGEGIEVVEEDFAAEVAKQMA